MDSLTRMRIKTRLAFRFQIFLLTLCLSVLLSYSKSVAAPSVNTTQLFDVLHYNITIEPDISNKTLKGSVVIRFVSDVNDLTSVEFDCGDLEIESVKQDGVTREFSVKDHR